MTTTYGENLRAAWRNAIDAFTDWAAAIVGRIEDPLYDDVARAKARLRCYSRDKEGVDNIITAIRSLSSSRESFLAYVEAAQFFVICDARPSVALGLLRSCITAEQLVPGGDWEHRVRIIGRMMATGKVTREDWRELAKQGIALPEADVDTKVTPETLAYAIERALPGWIGE